MNKIEYTVETSSILSTIIDMLDDNTSNINSFFNNKNNGTTLDSSGGNHGIAITKEIKNILNIPEISKFSWKINKGDNSNHIIYIYNGIDISNCYSEQLIYNVEKYDTNDLSYNLLSTMIIAKNGLNKNIMTECYNNN